MFFRTIAFLVGLIAVIAGLRSYDSTVATAPVPVVSGVLVMLIAYFNILPKIKRCTSCHKKIANKAETCRFCNTKQPPAQS